MGLQISPLTAKLPLLHYSSSTIHNFNLLSSPKPSFSTRLLLSCYHNEPSSPATVSSSKLWRTRVSSFQFFPTKSDGRESLKQDLLETIAPLDRGANATPEEQKRVDQIARKLEALSKVKEPLKSELLNGKRELLYTTSQSILQTKATANLVPLNVKRVAVKFDAFKVLGLIPIRARGSGRGQLEITYLDEN